MTDAQSTNKPINHKYPKDNLMVKVLRQISFFFLGMYRTVGSIFFGGNCRFEPSCSEYAQQALTQKPLKEAFALILRRLSKCHPWGPHGHDPLPKALTDHHHSA